jgi:hypothetical protein
LQCACMLYSRQHAMVLTTAHDCHKQARHTPSNVAKQQPAAVTLIANAL